MAAMSAVRDPQVHMLEARDRACLHTHKKKQLTVASRAWRPRLTSQIEIKELEEDRIEFVLSNTDTSVGELLP